MKKNSKIHLTCTCTEQNKLLGRHFLGKINSPRSPSSLGFIVCSFVIFSLRWAWKKIRARIRETLWLKIEEEKIIIKFLKAKTWSGPMIKFSSKILIR